MSKNLLLDTKGAACFLCRQEAVSDIENVISEVSLQTICRCLKINPESFSWKELPPKKKCDFSVIMCSTCSSTTKKLTDLINQIEMINNLLTYQLQVFHRTMKTSSGGNPDLCPAIKDLGTGSVEVDLVKRLRAAIKEKCSKKMKEIEGSNFPKVLLERLAPVEDEDDPCAATLIENRIAPPTTSDIPLTFSQPSSLSQSQLEYFNNPSLPKEILNDLCKKYSTQSRSEWRCSICDYVSSQGLPRIRIHLVNSHPEIIFISQKSYHLDNHKLLELNKRLFSKEIQQAKERGGIINGKQCFPCEFCDRKHFCHSNFKYHLLLDHFKIMETRLNHLIIALPSNQRSNRHKKRAPPNIRGPPCPEIKTPDRGQITSTDLCSAAHGKETSTITEMHFHKQMIMQLCRKNSSKTENIYLCSFCNYSTPRFFRIRTHLVNAHPQIFFISLKPTHVIEAKFRDYCRRLFSNESFKAKKRGNVINGKQYFLCEICNWKDISITTFKCHLLLEHFKILKRKLTDLFKAPSSNQKKGICPHPNKSNIGRHLRKNTCQKVKTRNLNLLEATGSQPDIAPDLGVEEAKQNCKTKAVKPPSKRQYRKPKKLEDGGSGKMFSKRSSLMNHKKQRSSSLGRRLRWICLFRDGGCGNTFSSKFTLQRHQKNICSKKKKKEVESKSKKEVPCQNGNAEPEDNFNMEMECSVENVEISKIEVMDMDNQDESEVTEFENVQEFDSDLTLATAIF